jgi:ABC-type antimicrobial peptide transport system permease subunit
LDAIGRAYKEIEKQFTMKYWFQDDTFNEIYKTEITASRLVLVFTVVALVIACVGIVGLATYNVHRKTKEIGIRRLLGASVSQVMVILTNEFVWVMCIAIVLACPLAWIATRRWLTGFAYHIDMPWWIYIATFGGIALVTMSIICLQGLKTAITNPTETLRSE